ncbi:hypothetical protein VPNG_04142 [Cytospora leucostoma]|uniref:DUF7053 domain-containing protein n=1 Tax=Cytospora leucostoma TaxID=1230097 RepID=A0A423XDI3_9PEZI|nr:hypothetical protein VPNG_04142 [Cytospora leucostoma]
MRSQHHLTVRVALPRDLPPEAVVSALQSYTAIIQNQAFVTHYEQTDVDTASVEADPFFRADGTGTASYKVYERVTFIPGVGKEISFPTVFQRFENGIRTRAIAPAGVTIYSQHVVSRIAAGDGNVGEGAVDEGARWLGDDRALQSKTARLSSKEIVDEVGGAEAGEYELVETLSLECNTMLMPFVKSSMEEAHRDICKKVIASCRIACIAIGVA